MLTDLRGHRAGVAHHCRFGRAVVRFAITGADPARYRGKTDNLTRLLLDHVGEHGAGVVERAVEIGANDKIPGFSRHFPGWFQLVDASVVDQNVDTTVFVYSSLY